MAKLPLNKPSRELMVDLINLTNGTRFKDGDFTFTAPEVYTNPEKPRFNTSIQATGTGTTAFVGPETMYYTRLDLDVLLAGTDTHVTLPETGAAPTLAEVLAVINERRALALSLEDLESVDLTTAGSQQVTLVARTDSLTYIGATELPLTLGADAPAGPTLPVTASLTIDRSQIIIRTQQSAYITYTLTVPENGALDGVEFSVIDTSGANEGRFMVPYGAYMEFEPGALAWTRPAWLEWGTHLTANGMNPENPGEIPIVTYGGFKFRIKDGTAAGTYSFKIPVSHHGLNDNTTYSFKIDFTDPATSVLVSKAISFDMVPFVAPTMALTITPETPEAGSTVHVKLDFTVAQPYLPEGGEAIRFQFGDSEFRTTNIVLPTGWASHGNDPSMNVSNLYVTGIEPWLAPGTYTVEFDQPLSPLLNPGDMGAYQAFYLSNGTLGTAAFVNQMFTLASDTPVIEEEPVYYKLLPSEEVQLNSFSPTGMTFTLYTGCTGTTRYLSSNPADFTVYTVADIANLDIESLELYARPNTTNMPTIYDAGRLEQWGSPTDGYISPRFDAGTAPRLVHTWEGAELGYAKTSSALICEVVGNWRDMVNAAFSETPDAVADPNMRLFLVAKVRNALAPTHEIRSTASGLAN